MWIPGSLSLSLPPSLSLSFPFFEGGPHAPMSNDQAEKPEDTAAVEPERRQQPPLARSLPSLALLAWLDGGGGDGARAELLHPSTRCLGFKCCPLLIVH